MSTVKTNAMLQKASDDRRADKEKGVYVETIAEGVIGPFAIVEKMAEKTVVDKKDQMALGKFIDEEKRAIVEREDSEQLAEEEMQRQLDEASK